MKKILLTLIGFMLFIPATYAEECSEETIASLKEQIKNIDFTYEYMPEGTKIDLLNDVGETFQTDVSNKIKVTVSNLPENYIVALYDGNTYYNLSVDLPQYMTGGAYTAKIYSSTCFQEISKYEIMIPYCNSNNDNIWDDGTYNSKNNENNSSKTTKLNILLVIIVVFLIIGVIILFIFLNRRRVRKNA